MEVHMRVHILNSSTHSHASEEENHTGDCSKNWASVNRLLSIFFHNLCFYIYLLLIHPNYINNYKIRHIYNGGVRNYLETIRVLFKVPSYKIKLN
jgi:hypothetical protein